jgi:hypothetical protein
MGGNSCLGIVITVKQLGTGEGSQSVDYVDRIEPHLDTHLGTLRIDNFGIFQPAE